MHLYQFVGFIVPTRLINLRKLLDVPFRIPHSALHGISHHREIAPMKPAKRSGKAFGRGATAAAGHFFRCPVPAGRSNAVRRAPSSP